LKKDVNSCAAVTLFNEHGSVLVLMRNPHLDTWMPGKWSVPGGHLLEEEEEKAGLARELYEETSLSTPVESLLFVERCGRIAFYTSDQFSGRIILDESENVGYAWISPSLLDTIDGVPDLGRTITLACQRRKEKIG